MANALRRRAWLVALLALVATGVLVAWTMTPATLEGLTIDSAAVMKAGEPDGSRKPVALATPTRIAVRFSVPDDLAALRAKRDLPFLAAILFACADEKARNFEVIVQRAEYFGDYGRVRMLHRDTAQGAVRYRYRAVFDDRLSKRIEGENRDQAALGVQGGLCFKIEGGSAASGLESKSLPLPSLR